MASEKDLLKLQQKLDSIEAKYASINSTSPFKGKEAAEFAKQFGSVDDALKSAEISMKGIRAEIQDSTSGLEGLKESFRDIGRELGNINSPLKNMKRDFNKLTGLADKLSDINYDLANSTLKETANIRKQVNLSFNRLAQRKKHLITQIESNKLSTQELSDAKELLALAEDATQELESKVGYQNDFNKALDNTEERQIKINNALGVSGGLVKGLGNFASKMGFGDISNALENINDGMSEMAVDLTDNGEKAASLGDKFKIMRTGLEGLGKTLGAQLNDPLVMLGMLGKGLKYLHDLAGKFGVQTREVAQTTGGMFSMEDMVAFKDTSGAIFEGVVKSAGELREELGFIPNLTKEMIQSQHMLTEGFGLSSKEAAGLLRISSATGVEYKDMSQTIAASSGEFEAQTGYATDTQNVMKELGNASASLRFNMKGSANELLKAANYSSLLGMSMDSIKSASETSLDFESSIQKEMEAEMFLQKNLNLEKYRYAALTGDAAGQAEELQRLIKENGPSLKGNVLAQEAFAGAIGISRDQLFDSLEAMELQEKLGFKSENAQKAYNALLAKGMTKEQAIVKLKKDGAKGIEDSVKAELAHKNEMKEVINELEKSLLPLAQTVSKLFSGIAASFEPVAKLLNKKIFGSFTIGSAIGAFAGGAMALKLIKSLFGGAKKTVALMEVGIMKVDSGGGGGGGGDYGSDGGTHGPDSSTKNTKNKNIVKRTDKNGKEYHYDKKTGQRAKNPNKTKPGRNKTKPGRNKNRRRGGGGFAGMLASTAAYMGADYLMSSMGGDGDSEEEGGGGMMGEAAMMTGSMGVNVAADAGINAASNIKPPKPKAPSTLGKMWKGITNLTSQAGGAIKSVGKKMISPAVQFGEYLSKNIKSIFPKVLKGSKGFLKGAITKVPIAGPLMEMLFAGYDINQLAKDKGLTRDELSSEIGKTLISSGLGVLMGSLAAGGVSSLQAIGIPGWLAAPLAYTGGDMVGRMLGNSIADHVGGPALGRGVIDLFGLGGGGASSNAGGMEPPKEMATGGIATRATNAIVGEAGAEAVIPLNAFYAKIDELITAVKSGGDVYIDGAKVGKSMVMATSRMG